MKEIELSVIIPVFNTEKYFRKCIDSVINALKKVSIKWEIIVINDGSNGDIEEIIKEYIEYYGDLIVFLSQENKGRGSARNVGLSNAKGKYINFIDSDDFIDDQMYIKMFSEINNEKCDIVICDFENIDYNNNKNNFRVEAKKINSNDNKWGCFDVLIMPSCCNKIIKKQLFENLKFPEDINYEDLATIPIVMLRAKKISYIPYMFYKYLQNEESVMHEKYGIKQLNLINAIEIVCNRIENMEISKDDNEKAKYMIYTRRFYEEILEKIMLSEDKNVLIKEFCNRINNVQDIFLDNKYYEELINSQNIIKRLANKSLYKAIKNKNYKLLNLYLSKKNYYRFFAIQYK